MTVAFYLAGVVAVIATLLVVTRHDTIHALLYLIVSLFAVAVVFYTLGAPFVAALEVIVYAGAIIVLFLFTVMLLNIGHEAEGDERHRLRPVSWLGPGLLAGVLARLEAEQFAAPRLAELRAALQSQGWPPSRWIARLKRLLDYLDSRRNMIVASLDLFVFWTLQCACAVETWRKQTGPAVRRWLATVGEFEALSSLGGYAYEHPADVFPEFADTSPRFEAEGLAHPLLAARDAVRNDF